MSSAVTEHSVAVNAAAWSEHLRAVPSVLDAVSVTGRISRANVEDVAQQSHRSGAWTPLLIAAYAWGQGTNGYGPYRLTKILHSDGHAETRLETLLGGALDAMREGTAADAYARLRRAVPGLGPAFFTKFLYFAGHAVHPRVGPAPLVLDAVVARHVRRIAISRADDAGLEGAAGLCAWLWSASGWSAHRYSVWLDFAAQATEQLVAAPGTPPWPARPDLLELAIFRGQLAA